LLKLLGEQGVLFLSTFFMSSRKTTAHMRAYFIPGLGTDCRIFRNLTKELEFEEVYFIDYKEDTTKNSADMADYANAISKDIIHDANSIIIGLSLGGIVATELSKLLPDCKIVLISSIKTKNEAPLVINFARFLPFYNLVPLWFSRNVVPFLSRIARVTDKEGYLLYRQMLKGWTAAKFKWARKSAVSWKNKTAIKCLHIHGTRDFIFPHSRIKNAIYIQKGSHYMVMDRASEIADIIKKEFKKDFSII
jgi:pimeloyl-ACP methyl ester carboxylesterase